jgi:hypothetical protein
MGFWRTNDIRVCISILLPTINRCDAPLTNTVGVTDILRRNNGAPVATLLIRGLSTRIILPAATYNGKRYYVILMGICGDGNNIYIDQLQTVNTYPSPTNSADVKHEHVCAEYARCSWGGLTTMWLGCVVLLVVIAVVDILMLHLH